MIKYPPQVDDIDVISILSGLTPEQTMEYFSFCRPLDSKGRYLPYNELRYRIPPGLDKKKVWKLIKTARNPQMISLLTLGETCNECRFTLTPNMQKAISETDRETTSAALKWMRSQVGEDKHNLYLLNDLVEDEAISSSQLEGAATTTRVAKELVKTKRKPRTIDEKMIIGNYKMMMFAWRNKHKELSTDLILEFHRVGVENINDDKYTPGVFRLTDDVVVEDQDNDIVHTPPAAKGIEKRITRLVKWCNQDHHNTENIDYMHPLIKAIVLHFALGYEHPFRDGNGRVARALFYWYMFKNNFESFRYIAISTLLKEAPVQYGKSYLYSETDEMDLTYFIDYQCEIIVRAIKNYKQAFDNAVKEKDAFNAFIFSSGLQGELNANQKIIFQAAANKNQAIFTVPQVKAQLGCSDNTARSALNSLVDMGIFEKYKKGKVWVYSMKNRQDIMNIWN